MSDAHVEHLLSRAYDDDLDAAQRALLDRHLAACAPCSAAYADLATVLGAVRSLPPARMPHPVRLPEGAPRAAARRWPWSSAVAIPPAAEARTPRWAGLPQRHPWVSGFLGAAAAAALVAAVVIPTTIGRGPEFGSGPSGEKAPNGAAMAPASQGALQPPNAPCGGCQSSAGCPVALSPGGRAVSVAIPTVYNNHEVQDDGVTTAIVATSVSSYSPGQSVEVYARLVDDRTGAVSLPCAFLVAASPSRSQLGLLAPTSGSAASLATPALGISGGVSVLEVRVPATATAGETLEIIVDVPAAGGEPAHQVSLAITVR
jgi:hypothetical protein